MSLRSLPNVIFDLGGVLLRWDTRAIVAAVFTAPEARRQVHAAVFEHPDWLALDQGTLAEEEAILRFARRSSQPPAAMAALMEAVRTHLTPVPAALALVEELAAARVPLFGLSNMHARNADYLTATHGFFRLFVDFVFSARVRLIKPDPAIYAYAAARFGLEPAHCVFVDDSAANVAGARQAGWQAVHFSEAAACRQELLRLARERGARGAWAGESWR